MPEPIDFAIFPLDSVILVPGGVLPLHIFEPRYRKMIADALEGDRRIAMALILPGFSADDMVAPPVHEVCGLGVIVHHQSYDDGRADIVLRGQQRVRIVEEIPTDRPYRTVRGLPLPDIYPAGEDLRSRALKLLSRIEGFGGDDRDRLEKLTPGRIVDAVLSPMPSHVQDKQRIHARADVAWRIRELEVLMDWLQGSRYAPDLRPEDPRLN